MRVLLALAALLFALAARADYHFAGALTQDVTRGPIQGARATIAVENLAGGKTTKAAWVAVRVEGALQNPQLNPNQVRMGSRIPIPARGAALWGP